MKIFALFTWIATASLGLYLFAIWLIEYDRDFQRRLATRLPVPVVSTHALLAVTGLTLWVSNFILQQARLVWAALAILGAVAVLGFTMAYRWLRVYRSTPDPVMATAGAPEARTVIPAERNFPVSVVIWHGVFAVTTVVLVALTALGVGR